MILHVPPCPLFSKSRPRTPATLSPTANNPLYARNILSELQPFVSRSETEAIVFNDVTAHAPKHEDEGQHPSIICAQDQPFNSNSTRKTNPSTRDSD